MRPPSAQVQFRCTAKIPAVFRIYDMAQASRMCNRLFFFPLNKINVRHKCVFEIILVGCLDNGPTTIARALVEGWVAAPPLHSVTYISNIFQTVISFISQWWWLHNKINHVCPVAPISPGITDHFNTLLSYFQILHVEGEMVGMSRSSPFIIQKSTFMVASRDLLHVNIIIYKYYTSIRIGRTKRSCVV